MAGNWGNLWWGASGNYFRGSKEMQQLVFSEYIQLLVVQHDWYNKREL